MAKTNTLHPTLHMKHGHIVPRTHVDAIALDESNGNTLWKEAEELEIKLLNEYPGKESPTDFLHSALSAYMWATLGRSLNVLAEPLRLFIFVIQHVAQVRFEPTHTTRGWIVYR
jgi:hypothetical protein